MARKRRRGGQTSSNRKTKLAQISKVAESANSEASNEDSDNSYRTSLTEHTSSPVNSNNIVGKTVTEGIHKKFGKFRCVIDKKTEVEYGGKNQDNQNRVTIEDVSDNSEEASQNIENRSYLEDQMYTIQEEVQSFRSRNILNEENVQIVSIEDNSLSSEQSNMVYFTIEQTDKTMEPLQETSREQVLEIVQGNIFKYSKVESNSSSVKYEQTTANAQTYDADNQEISSTEQAVENVENAEIVYLHEEEEEMQYTEVDNTETESLKIADKLSTLNVNSDFIIEYSSDSVNNVAECNSETINVEKDEHSALICEDSQKSNEVIYGIENLGSELTIECVSEEVISAEQELDYEIADEIKQVKNVNIGNSLQAAHPGNRRNIDNLMEDHPLFKETELIEENDVSDNEESLDEQTSPDDIEGSVDTVYETEERSDSNDSSERQVMTKTTKQKRPEKLNKKLTKAKKSNKKPQQVNKEVLKEPKKKKISDRKDSVDQEKLGNTEVRRSNRIKSISTKQKERIGTPTKAKTSSKTKKNTTEFDITGNISSGNTDTDKPSSDSLNFMAPNLNNEQKPVKVKSRWRRSSELEMGGNRPEENNQSYTNNNKDVEEKIMTAEDEIKMRLKQFVHLKDNSYLTDRVCCKEAKKMICDCFLTQEEIERGEYGCGEDCLNRLLMIECGPLCSLGDRCTNKRFQKAKSSPCEVFRTEKKGLGIRATRTIGNGEFILEYVGEVIDPDEFENRATEYSKGKNPHFYFMALRSDAVIDATQKGNISRFINHSCEPNAETQKWTVNGELRIGFFSKKTIQLGDEVTFDYHFQRYGKEAQKCYCEAPSCRGWLGEEPDEDDEDEDVEEEEEEEEEIEEDEVEDEKIKEVIEINKSTEVKNELEEEKVEHMNEELIKEHVTQPSEEIKKDSTDIEEIAKPKLEKKKVIRKEKSPKIKPIKILQKTRKELFDDPDVNQEIQMLMTTGLKNQVHTLKLSRLMVRATETLQKSNLLRVLRRGEFPCRRLFLDYHGLRLIHGWMTEAQKNCKMDLKQESLRLEILQTLATLPIPNKTMLQDSKVLPTVEKWSAPLKIEDGLDSDSNSPKLETEEKDEEESIVEETSDRNPNKNNKGLETDNENTKYKGEKNLEETECRKSVGMDFENIVKLQDKSLSVVIDNLNVEDFANMFEDDISFIEKGKQKEIKSENPDYEVEIVALALKLLEEWSSLKEVFRIPKKERIERMKEHEREANRGYKTALEHELERKRSSRYRHLQRHSKVESAERIRKHYPVVESKNIVPSPKFNKHERRKLFALQVEQEEEEKRRKMQGLTKQEVAVLSGDLRFSLSQDIRFQYMWNPQTGQWQKVQILNQNLQNNQTTINQNPPPLNLNQNLHNLNRNPLILNDNFQCINQTPPNLNLQGTHPSPSMLNHNVPPNVNQSPANFNTTASRLPYPFSSYSSTVNTNSHPQLPPAAPSNFSNIQPITQHLPPQLPNISHITQFPRIVPTNTLPNTPSPIQSTPNRPPLRIPTPSVVNISPLANINPPLPSGPPLPNTSPLSSTNNLPNPHHLPNVLPLPVPAAEEKKEDASQVKFAGPIPPPVKLPPKWKCAKDKYGRPYYYHIKIRISQWEPPEFPPIEESEDESSDTTSSSETSSVSSDSSDEESDSDEDEVDDTKLMLEIKRNLNNIETKSVPEQNTSVSPNEEVEQKGIIANEPSFEKKQSLEERLKEEFNVMKGSGAPPVKRRRTGLITEVYLISPRSEEDKILAKENLKKYKDNKEKLKRQKELLLKKSKQPKEQPPLEQPKKRVRVTIKSPKHKKHKEKERTKEVDSETARKIKEAFRTSMASIMVGILNPYRKPECKEGHISNNDDFKHLARKLTHFVMLKELKHCKNIEDLTCTDSVKNKAKEFVRKYMSKFGETYIRPKDEMDF